jgi:hypothetical protein
MKHLAVALRCARVVSARSLPEGPSGRRLCDMRRAKSPDPHPDPNGFSWSAVGNPHVLFLTQTRLWPMPWGLSPLGKLGLSESPWCPSSGNNSQSAAALVAAFNAAFRGRMGTSGT